jgi:hypothetical protein
MADRDTQLRNYSLEYGKLSDDYATPHNRGAVNVADATDRMLKIKRMGDIKVSKTPQLYRLIKKNADSMIKFGSRSFPSMSCDPNTYRFSNSENLSKTLDALDPAIDALGKFNLAKKASFKGHPVSPCVVSHDGGQTETDRMLTKSSNDDLKEMNPKVNISKEGLDLCADGPECYDCLDCEPHRQELRKAVNGIYSNNPGDDETRMFHVKNLISTLNSWASHHDTRGGDAESCNDPNYNSCNDLHQTMATHLRSMADKLTSAIKSDYQNTKGYGGAAEHRDAIYGNNTMEA